MIVHVELDVGDKCTPPHGSSSDRKCALTAASTVMQLDRSLVARTVLALTRDQLDLDRNVARRLDVECARLSVSDLRVARPLPGFVT